MNTDIFPDKTVLLATHNKKKIVEIRAMFEPHGITVISAADKNLPEPDETGVTFAENAELKAVAAARATGLPAIADDSGFCCEALYGGPGIYSARFAATKGGWTGGMQAVLDAAKSNPAKTAWFITVLCLALPTGESYFFEGIVKGSLAQSMRGTGGFGYDPIFIPDGHDRTFGEMTEEEKNSMSHRRLAFDKFMSVYFGNNR